jgi:hypothetical protein
MQADRTCNSSDKWKSICESDQGIHGHRVELPQFDGANPKLWQRRCVEYFQRCNIPEALWASYSSGQFTGAAATWLESFLQQHPSATWAEFSSAVLNRFSRNQHQILVRRLFHISQETTVEDYVDRFSDLMDQIAAYETHPDPIHYTTRFLDGLNAGVPVLVAIQQPKDLDTAYTLALLYEELGGSGSSVGHAPTQTAPHRRQHHSHQSQAQPQFSQAAQPPLPPPAKWVSKAVEEKRAQEQRSGNGDRWTSLRAYRRSRGLCFTCGEKYGRDHQCKTTIQLHVVQELIDCMYPDEPSDSEQPENEQQGEPPPHLPQQ